MTLAFNSKHPYVPNPSKDPGATRWIASLSDGSTVFEDRTPNEMSAWIRLSNYIKLHRLKITNLRLEAYGKRVVLIPHKSTDNIAQLNGYWHSRRINSLLDGSGVKEYYDCGIGYLKAFEVFITWVSQDGTIRHEIRPYKPNDKAIIINDEP